MKYLVDTCGWIEWLTDGKFAQSFSKYLSKPSSLIVPTIIQYELYKWINNNHDEMKALEVIAHTEQAEVIALDSKLALLAADIARHYKLAMADAIIYATAEQVQARIITSDDHFSNLPNVVYFDKK